MVLHKLFVSAGVPAERGYCMIVIDKRFTIQERILINSVIDAICKNGDGDQLLPDIEIKKSLQLTRAAGNCRVNVTRQTAVIKINGKLEFTDDYFKQVVAHEFIHSFKSAIHDNHHGNWAKFATKYSKILGVEITEYVECESVINQIREYQQSRQRQRKYRIELYKLIYDTALKNTEKLYSHKYSESQMIEIATKVADDLYKEYA